MHVFLGTHFSRLENTHVVLVLLISLVMSLTFLVKLISSVSAKYLVPWRRQTLWVVFR
jgi:hypothetical protein